MTHRHVPVEYVPMIWHRSSFWHSGTSWVGYSMASNNRSGELVASPRFYRCRDCGEPLYPIPGLKERLGAPEGQREAL